MKKLFFIMLFPWTSQMKAQNNPIFFGGFGEGWVLSSSLVNTTTLTSHGGIGDGWILTSNVLNDTPAFCRGGSGDGWILQSNGMNYTSASNIGGQGDGWMLTSNAISYTAPAHKGGSGDGWAASYTPVGPLPVTLLQFEAQKWNEQVKLTWSTSLEINSSYYTIERSRDAVDFEFLGTVQSKNSTQGASYALLDSHPFAGYNYYRIKMVDLDGKFKYTPTRHVLFDQFVQAGDVLIYPIPTTGELFLEVDNQIKAQELTINFTNSFGQVVRQEKRNTSEGKIMFDLNTLAKGVYYVHIKSTSIHRVEKIIIH